MSNREIAHICENCLYWGREQGWLTENIGMDARFCQHPSVCRPHYGSEDQKKMKRDGVYLADEGGITGELITGPDFGCIHFWDRNF